MDYAQRVIDQFRNQFGEGHFAFACQAAFPIAITPDLLYQLWANFHQYPSSGDGAVADIPMIAISDLLLSSLCEKVGPRTFEMDNLVRARLLEHVPPHRKKEIAYFLFQYIEANLQDRRQSTFFKSLYWNTLVTIAPQNAFLELTTQLSEAVHKNQEGEIFRLRNLLEAFAQQDKGLEGMETSGFHKLFSFSKAIKASMLDYPDEVINQQLKQTVTLRAGAENIGRVALPIRKEMVGKVNLKEFLYEEESSDGVDRNLYAILVGINKYDRKSNLLPLNSSLNDVSRVQHYLETTSSSKTYKLHLYRLLDEEATQQNVSNHLTMAIDHASERDIVLFYFSGYSSPMREQKGGGPAYGLVFHDTPPSAPFNLDAAVKDETRDNIFLICETSESAALLLEQPHDHIALYASCGPGERSKQFHETRQSGLVYSAFTYHLTNILSRSQVSISNDALIQEVRDAIYHEGIAQTPRLVTAEVNNWRPFLQKRLGVEKTHALIIGMEKAPGNLGEIEGCHADAHAIEKLLMGFSQQNNRPINSLLALDRDATLGKVTQTINSLKNLKEGDSFFFYFAGPTTGSTTPDFQIDFKGPNLVLFDEETDAPVLLTLQELCRQIFALIAQKELHCCIALNAPPSPEESIVVPPELPLKGSLVLIHGSGPDEGIHLRVSKGNKKVQSFFSQGLEEIIRERGFIISYESLVNRIQENLGSQHPVLLSFPDSARQLSLISGRRLPAGNGMKGDLYALLIGINDYHPQSKVTSLKGSILDIDAVENALNELHEKMGSKFHIQRLENQEANFERVLKEINRIFSSAGNEDHIFIYFTGHGDDTADGRNSLVLYDSRIPGGKELYADDLKPILQKAASNPEVLMVLDSGREWLDSNNPKHVFISIHPTNRELPATQAGSFGNNLSELLRVAEDHTYRSLFRGLLEKYQRREKFQLRCQLYAHPSFSKRYLFRDEYQFEENLQTTEGEPIFLLVFSNPDGHDLQMVVEERRELEALFQDSDLELMVLHNPVAKDLEEAFCNPDYRSRIHLFHFAGLATGASSNGSPNGFVLSDGVLDFLTFLPWLDHQDNIKLAFLNACYSNHMAEWMGQLGVVACLGCEETMNDRYFKEAALKFYHKWISGEKDIKATYEETIGQEFGFPYSGAYVNRQHRSVSMSEDEATQAGFHFYSAPWANTVLSSTIYHYPKRAKKEDQTISKERPDLYALLVGIGNYQSPAPKLPGVDRDLKAMEEFLREEYNQTVEFGKASIRTLLDKEATKANIVQAFKDHLGQAQPGDAILFYFSGLGTSEAADPEIFQYLPDRRLDCLVCYDSVEEDSNIFNFLADVEIRWLIQEIKQKTQGHILTIYDCCFTSETTRNISVNREVFEKCLVNRYVGNNFPERAWNDFIFSKTIPREEFSTKPPPIIFPSDGHVSLHASRQGEPADQEKDGGVFTKSLLKVLFENGKELNYSALTEKVRRETSKYSRQAPQIFFQETSDVYLQFLGVKPKEARAPERSKLTVCIQAEEEFASQAERLTSELENAVNIALTLSEHEADYCVVIRKEGINGFGYLITYPGEAKYYKDSQGQRKLRPLTLPVTSLIETFPEKRTAANLKHIAQWEYVKKLSNPGAFIFQGGFPLDIRLEVSKDENWEEAPMNNEAWAPVLQLNEKGKLARGCRVRIRNNYTRKLYVSVVSLSLNFEVYPAFLNPPNYGLNPGEEKIIDTIHTPKGEFPLVLTAEPEVLDFNLPYSPAWLL
jgi:hypothetical protein